MTVHVGAVRSLLLTVLVALLAAVAPAAALAAPRPGATADGHRAGSSAVDDAASGGTTVAARPTPVRLAAGPGGAEARAGAPAPWLDCGAAVAPGGDHACWGTAVDHLSPGAARTTAAAAPRAPPTTG